MAIDDVIRAARNAAKNSGKVVSHKTTQAAVNNLDDVVKAAKNVTGHKTTEFAVRNLDENIKAAKEIVGHKPTEFAVRNFDENVKAARQVTGHKTVDNAIVPFEQRVETAREVMQKNNLVPQTRPTLPVEQKIKNAQEVINNNNQRIPKTTNGFDTTDAIDVEYIEQNQRKGNRTQQKALDNSSGGNGNKPPNGPETSTNTPDPEEPKMNRIHPNKNNSGDTGNANNQRSWKDYGNKYFGGIGDTYRSVRDGGNFFDALEAAHKNTDGSMRWDRVAGTYAAAALGARVLSGGGLTKDKYGNSNLPGIPFI